MDRIISLIKNRKNFIVYTTLRILIMILGLYNNIIIVRKLDVNSFGTFSIVLMMIGLFTTFGFSWSSSSILYYGSKEKAKRGSINQTFWARNIIITCSFFISALLFIIFREQLNSYLGLDVAGLIFIWLLISVTEDYLSQYFLAVKRQLISSLLSISAKIIYLILIVFVSYDVKQLIVLNIISHSTVLFYIIFINKRDVGKFEFNKQWFKEVLNFSLWQLFGFSGLYLINFGDTAVIKHFLTLEDVGVYNAAYRLFDAIAGFAFVIINFYASSITECFTNNARDKLKQFFYKDRFLIFAISLVAHIAVIIGSNHIISFLYGEKYLGAVGIFNVLMIGSIFRYLAVFYTLYYNTNNKYKVLQYLNIIRAILNLCLDLVFIRLFGLIGPAYATTIALILTFLFSVCYCENKLSRACNIKKGLK